jgi:hypothetical protein
MRAVLKKCPTVSSKLVKAAGIELDDFATSFKDSRDFYTHYNPRAGAEIRSCTAPDPSREPARARKCRPMPPEGASPRSLILSARVSRREPLRE